MNKPPTGKEIVRLREERDELAKRCELYRQQIVARDAAVRKRASEPSQEAKQAAEEWAQQVWPPECDKRAYALGYDAATAKAREELAEAREQIKRIADFAALVVNAKRDNAHQQPSATTANENNQKDS